LQEDNQLSFERSEEIMKCKKIEGVHSIEIVRS